MITRVSRAIGSGPGKTIVYRAFKAKPQLLGFRRKHAVAAIEFNHGKGGTLGTTRRKNLFKNKQVEES